MDDQNQDRNVDRLAALLGFDPARESPADGVFAEAMREINEERARAQKERASQLIRQAIALREQMHHAERQFESQRRKFHKDLGKLVARIEALAAGKAAPDPDEHQD